MKNPFEGYIEELEVDEFPICIFCGKEARFNARTQADLWCYLCEDCFIKYGRGLDPVDGQKLVIKPKGGKDADL